MADNKTKSDAVEAIITVFQAQTERINILSERVDLLLENAKNASEVSVLLANRIISLENQLGTLLNFIVTGITTPNEDEDVH